MRKLTIVSFCLFLPLLSLSSSALLRPAPLDAASRYVCLHPACASLPLSQRQFPLWSHLQKHTKIAHPPTCPHPECRGKTFTTTRGLKNHLLIHEREAEKGEEGKDFADPTQRSNVKRKRSERRKKKERREQEQQVVVKTEDEENDLGGNSTQGLDEDEEGSDWERRQENERDQRMRDDFRLGGKKKRRVYEDSVRATLPRCLGLPFFHITPLMHSTMSRTV